MLVQTGDTIRLEWSAQYRRRMAHRNVETLIGRLATDSSLRRRFLENPQQVVHEFREQGYELTPVELEALASIDGNAIRSFAGALDRRIRRAEVRFESNAKEE